MVAWYRLARGALGVCSLSAVGMAIPVHALPHSQTIYGYDALGRLIGAVQSDGTSSTYAYDRAESTTRGRLAGKPFAQGGSLAATVQPGEQIRFYIDAFTSARCGELGFDVSMYNATTNEFLEHHHQSGVVDSDDKHNRPAAASPDPFSLEAIRFAPGGSWQVLPL